MQLKNPYAIIKENNKTIQTLDVNTYKSYKDKLIWKETNKENIEKYKKLKNSIICPYCLEKLVFVDPKNKIKHFRHINSECSNNKVSNEAESIHHLNAKNLVVKQLQFFFNKKRNIIKLIKLETEYIIYNNIWKRRIADIYYEFEYNWKIYKNVIEIQYSNIPQELLLERHLFYKELWIKDLWIIWENKENKENKAEKLIDKVATFQKQLLTTNWDNIYYYFVTEKLWTRGDVFWYRLSKLWYWYIILRYLTTDEFDYISMYDDVKKKIFEFNNIDYVCHFIPPKQINLIHKNIYNYVKIWKRLWKIKDKYISQIKKEIQKIQQKVLEEKEKKRKEEEKREIQQEIIKIQSDNIKFMRREKKIEDKLKQKIYNIDNITNYNIIYDELITWKSFLDEQEYQLGILEDNLDWLMENKQYAKQETITEAEELIKLKLKNIDKNEEYIEKLEKRNNKIVEKELNIEKQKSEKLIYEEIDEKEFIIEKTEWDIIYFKEWFHIKTKYKNTFDKYNIDDSDTKNRKLDKIMHMVYLLYLSWYDKINDIDYIINIFQKKYSLSEISNDELYNACDINYIIMTNVDKYYNECKDKINENKKLYKEVVETVKDIKNYYDEYSTEVLSQIYNQNITNLKKINFDTKIFNRRIQFIKKHKNIIIKQRWLKQYNEIVGIVNTLLDILIINWKIVKEIVSITQQKNIEL